MRLPLLSHFILIEINASITAFLVRKKKNKLCETLLLKSTPIKVIILLNQYGILSGTIRGL